jgi:DNA-binding IclR family transcriptional regulator
LETNAHLAVLYEDEVLYLDREEAALSVVIPSAIGKRVPPHCTALGKVLLAYQPEVAERVLSQRELPAMTPHTHTSPLALGEEIARVRELGHAVDDEEFHQGNVCVAAPVRNWRGTVIAAVSVSFPKVRLEYEPLEKFVSAVTEGTESISQAMGYTK